MTLKESLEDEFDKYMLVSFQTNTLVLNIGEGKISEVQNPVFYTNERTLHIGILEDNSYI